MKIPQFSTHAACLLAAFAASLLPSLARAAPVTYAIKPGAGQSVRFDARTNTERYSGHTDQIEGSVRVDPANIADHPVATFTVRPASFSTGNGSRDSNMRRKHLFVDVFPTATFTLSALDIPAGGAPPLAAGKPVTGTAHGTLTLHGVTRTVVPTITVTRERDAATGRDALHIVAAFVVRLDDYRIPTPRFLFITVKQDHPVTVDIRAVAP